MKKNKKVEEFNNQEKKVEEFNNQEILSSEILFPSAIYSVNKTSLLPMVKTVVDENLALISKETSLDEIYPVRMTGNLINDPQMKEFCKYVGDTAWGILYSQGYQMNGLSTFFLEMWAQEHHKHSAMEQHTHGFGSQLVGFYFIDVPENSSKVVFHDAKAAKVQINLPEIDSTQATFASNTINFTPKPGLLMFTNSWLAHSFSRHASDQALTFIHFNIAVNAAPPQNNSEEICVAPAEII
tara:strand:+ start:7232 stop:7951 length:720 start_codon:yes stop_codon:yes gene_type:complete